MVQIKQSAKSFISNQPWSNQAFLKQNKIPDMGKIIWIASEINNIRDRCLFVITYLTAGRIREIIRKGKFPSIKKEDISIEYIKDKSGKTKRVFLIDMRNQKNKNRKRKKIPIPISIEDKENITLVNMALEYLSEIEDSDELFPFNYDNAYRIIKKICGWNPHFFRDIRLSHLAVDHNFSDQKLKMYAGWSDSRPARNYIDMRWIDLI